MISSGTTMSNWLQDNFVLRSDMNWNGTNTVKKTKPVAAITWVFVNCHFQTSECSYASISIFYNDVGKMWIANCG